jgi:ketosteroid isomerase-like protein
MVMDTQPISQELVTRHVVGQVVNAIAAGDWDALAVCVAPDMVYWRPGTGDRVDGMVGYVEEWRSFVASTAALQYRPHTVLVQGDTAMVEATAEGRFVDGTPLRYSMVSVLRVAGGRLVEEREYIVPASPQR